MKTKKKIRFLWNENTLRRKTMLFKVNLQAIKDRLETNKEKNTFQKFKKPTIEENPLLKMKEAGVYNFRALPYVHNKDIAAEPFCERTYHFNIPGNYQFYCVKQDEKECPICEFVWSQMKENKGNKPQIIYWRQFLPKKRVAIPGIVRGREEEGIKFFLLSTFDERLGDHYDKIIKYLTKPSTCNFLDPESGYDLELTYEDYKDGREKKFGKFGFKDLELARELSSVSDDPKKFWKDLPNTMKMFDRDVPGYEKKTVEDAHAAMEKWLQIQEKLSKKTAASSTLSPPKDNDDDDGDDDEVIATHDAQDAAEAKAEAVAKSKEKAAATSEVAAKAKALLAKKMEAMNIKS